MADLAVEAPVGQRLTSRGGPRGALVLTIFTPAISVYRWLCSHRFGAAAGQQEAAGIIRHAANQSMDDPSVAIVYHQAASFDALKAFLADPDLKANMEAAGVAGPPDVSFHVRGSNGNAPRTLGKPPRSVPRLQLYSVR